MSEVDYATVARFEHSFWLQVLGDHARFIRTGLSPTETKEIERTERYQVVFDDLLTSARSMMDASGALQLSQRVLPYAKRFREFKLHLLRRHLDHQIAIHLSPTFLNHMVNELEEYLRLLGHFVNHQVAPPVHPVHHHLLWMSDAAGHASIIDTSLDKIEVDLKAKAQIFSNHFDQFYLKAVELAGYLRTQSERFPALVRFNQQAALEFSVFMGFLQELEELGLSSAVLGTITPLMPDHMARESCYYINKLASVTEVKTTSCDPTSPRVQN